MEQYGVAGARLTPYQKIVLIGVDADQVEPLVDALDAIGLPARPSDWRQNTMACTGIEFCKLAIVETKARARDLVAELERRFPELDVPITVNVNGCPNACARTQVADIGLKGQLVMHEGAAGRRLPGAPRRRHRAAGQLRPQAARPQGDQRRARRLRRPSSSPTSWPTARTASRSRPGSPAPTRSCCAARGPSRRCRHDRARRPLPLPLLRRAGPVAARGRDESGRSAPRRSWECRGCLRAFSLKMLGLVRPELERTGERPHDRRDHPVRTQLARDRDRRAAPPRSCASWSRTGAPSSSWPRPRTSSSGRPRPSATGSAITSSMGDAVLAHLASQGRARHRRGLPRHRLPLRRDDRHPRRGRRDAGRQPAHDHARPERAPSRTRRTARTSTRPTPTCAASCARCSR